MLRILSLFCDMETSLKYAANPRVLFESVAVKAARPDSDYSIDALLTRIKELENKLSEIEKSGIKVSATDIPSEKEENSVEVKEQEVTPEKPEIKDVRGALLVGIRNSGSEMLYNVLQSVSVGFANGILTLTTKTESDRVLLDMESSKEVVRSALKDLGEFSIVVKQSEENKDLDEIELETERLKKAFGEDIVIIK